MLFFFITYDRIFVTYYCFQILNVGRNTLSQGFNTVSIEHVECKNTIKILFKIFSEYVDDCCKRNVHTLS